MSDICNVIKSCFRYEIYIPLNYNDGTLVNSEKMLNTTNELMTKFSGLTTYPFSLKASGLWRENDKICYDEMMVYRLDVETKNDELDYFIEYKKKLKVEYKQIEIYLTRQKIEII